MVVPGNPVPEGAEIIWFEGRAGRHLRACLCPAPADSAPRGTVIVCPGRTEFIEKYFEVARELQARGFGALIIDWPGQGLSDRLLPDHQKGHIDSFQTFMGALQRGLEKAGDRMPKPHVVLAHSMGGAIALGALLEHMFEVKAAAFSSPMWGVKSPVMGLRYLVWAMRVLGRGKTYAQPVVPDRFETNIVTHCEARWRLHDAIVKAQPDIGLGPVTWGWLGAALDVVGKFAKDERVRALDIPIFVASAEEEKLVDNARQKRICDLLPDCEHVVVKGAMHEILMETDERRAVFWDGFDRALQRAGV